MQTYNFRYILVKQASIVIFIFNAWKSKAYSTLQMLLSFFSFLGRIKLHPSHTLSRYEFTSKPLLALYDEHKAEVLQPIHLLVRWCWGFNRAENWTSSILHSGPCSAANWMPSGNMFAFMGFTQYSYGFYWCSSWTKIISSFLLLPHRYLGKVIWANFFPIN